MDVIEKIGKITLDYSDYPGQDLYCDGAVEDEMLDIVKNYSSVEFQRIIEERKSWPIFYHLSPFRENIVSWLPITGEMKVLEIGSGCGAITGALSKKAGEVTCVELSKKRSLINAYRHEDCDNVTIKLGNFMDVEKHLDQDFDFALLIGVLEYGQLYIGGDTPFEDFIKLIRNHVKSRGTIVIAIENKFGLKYWAGCREDHLGTFFSGIEDYPEGGGVHTFSQKELIKMFKNCEEKEYTFYYPYPDYKFMTTLFSDKALPKKGELCNNYRNFDRDRMLLFDEKKVFDEMLDEGMFPFYSNSYLAVLGPKPETDYIRYSNDRAPQYQISTEIATIDGQKIVKKHALCNESIPHIQNMKKNYVLLSKRYDDPSFSVNPIMETDREDEVCFPFERGTTLSQLLDECLESGDTEGFMSLFRSYVEYISHNEVMLVADYDLAFSNILIDRKKWKVIDYEWTFEKQIATKELAFRALYCYLLEDEKRNKFNFDLILQELGITGEEVKDYQEKEMAFQQSVTRKRMSMSQLRDLIGGAMIVPQDSFNQHVNENGRDKVQIYFDRGTGFCEEDSFFIEELYSRDGSISFTFEIPSTVKKVRIDPYRDCCMTKLEGISLNQEEIILGNNKQITVNGKKLEDNSSNETLTIAFYQSDPGITIDVESMIRSTGNKMNIAMKTIGIPDDMAAVLGKELKRKIRL